MLLEREMVWKSLGQGNIDWFSIRQTALFLFTSTKANAVFIAVGLYSKS